MARFFPFSNPNAGTGIEGPPPKGVTMDSNGSNSSLEFSNISGDGILRFPPPPGCCSPGEAFSHV